MKLSMLSTGLVMIATAACAVELEAEDPVLPIAKQSSNALVENAIARFAPELNELVKQAFVDGPLTRKIASVAAGHRLLEYSARCIFEPGQTVVLTDPPNAPRTVPREPPLGLGPKWVDGPLSSLPRRSPGSWSRSPARSTASSSATWPASAMPLRPICSLPSKPAPSPIPLRAAVHRSRGLPGCAPRFSTATPFTPSASSTPTIAMASGPREPVRGCVTPRGNPTA